MGGTKLDDYYISAFSVVSWLITNVAVMPEEHIALSFITTLKNSVFKDSGHFKLELVKVHILLRFPFTLDCDC